VDLTSFDSPESEQLRKHYNIAGVPTIVFLNGNGQEVKSARVIGYLPPAQFLERVKEASPAL
jgi:thiol:disulfide interchange protein DsbD